MANNSKSDFRLPVQGKAVIRKDTTAYYRADLAAYYTAQGAIQKGVSETINKSTSCYKVSQAYGMDSFCSGPSWGAVFGF